MKYDEHCIAFDRDEDSLWGHCTCGHSTDEHEGTLGPCLAADDVPDPRGGVRQMFVTPANDPWINREDA